MIEQAIRSSNLKMAKKVSSWNIMNEMGTSLGTMQILLFLMIVLLRTCTALKVSVPNPSVTAQSGSSVLLECYFNETSDAVNLNYLVLTWRFQKGEVAKYDEDDEEIVTKIPRAEIFTDELQKGNASLLLRDITSADAGKYTCSVQHTVNEIQVKKLTLNVMDPPVTTKPTLIPTEVPEVKHVSTDFPVTTKSTRIPTKVTEMTYTSSALPTTTEAMWTPTEIIEVKHVTTDFPETTKAAVIPTEVTRMKNISTDLPVIKGTTKMPAQDKNLPRNCNSGLNIVPGALIFSSVIVGLYLL